LNKSIVIHNQELITNFKLTRLKCEN